MLMIRFQRIGRTNDPAFRIAVLEKERAAKAGRIVAQVGTYNPKTKAVTLKEDEIKSWIQKGAQPTGTVHNLLISKGVISGEKINVLPKKTLPKVEEKGEEKPAAPVATAENVAASEAAPAEATPAEEAPVEKPKEAVAPTEAEVAGEEETAEAPV